MTEEYMKFYFSKIMWKYEIQIHGQEIQSAHLDCIGMGTDIGASQLIDRW